MPTLNFKLDLDMALVPYLRDAYATVLQSAADVRSLGKAKNGWFVKHYCSCDNLENALHAMYVSHTTRSILVNCIDHILQQYCEQVPGMFHRPFPFTYEREPVELRWHNQKRLHYLETVHKYLEELCNTSKK